MVATSLKQGLMKGEIQNDSKDSSGKDQAIVSQAEAVVLDEVRLIYRSCHRVSTSVLRNETIFLRCLVIITIDRHRPHEAEVGKDWGITQGKKRKNGASSWEPLLS